MVFTYSFLVPKSNKPFFNGNQVERYIAVLFPSQFFKSLETSCLPYSQDKRTLEMDMLVIETANNFTNFYPFVSQLAWKHKCSCRGCQSDCSTFLEISY